MGAHHAHFHIEARAFHVNIGSVGNPQRPCSRVARSLSLLALRGGIAHLLQAWCELAGKKERLLGQLDSMMLHLLAHVEVLTLGSHDEMSACV